MPSHLFFFAALEFASPAMLGWAAAAALPWLVNLWTRRRHVETSWAAIDLLMAAVRERSRRLKLRELLLLVLRTAILLLAALAAARPTWYATAGAGSTARVHHVIVVDRSLSMSSETEEATRLEMAKRRAMSIVAAAGSGDAISVLAWADDAQNLLGRPTFDELTARAAIESIEPSDAMADLTSAARAVDEAIDGARREFTELPTRVTFISDLAINTWGGIIEGSASQEDLSQSWRKMAKNGDAVLLKIDERPRRNFAITGLRLEPMPPTVVAPATVTVQTASLGSGPAQQVSLELLVDGKLQGERDVTLVGGETIATSFDVRFDKLGGHIVESRLKAEGDPLERDNRRWFSVNVSDGVKAVCFADDPREAVDTARALNPRFDQAGGSGAIDIEIMPAGSIGNTELQGYEAVLLGNVAELSPREERVLRNYVRQGGALLAVLGDRISPSRYNQLFNDRAGQGGEAAPLLPIAIADSPTSGQWRLDPRGYEHPVVAPFAGRARAGLLGVQVSRYFPIKIPADAAQADVPLSFTSGDPAIAIAGYGSGSAAVLATNPALDTEGDEPWSTLAVSPSFVPLMRELFSYLTAERQVERLNQIVGEPLPVEGAQSWRSPTGESMPGAVPTERIGVYQLEGSAEAATSADERPPLMAVAVNADPRESDLAAIDAANLLSKDPSGVDAGFRLASASPSGGRPLAGYLLMTAGVLLIVELTLAWLFGRGAA